VDIRVVVKGCDDSTEFELVCTEEQYAFLKELAGATQTVSTFSCMPIILLKDNSWENEDVPTNSDNLKWVEEVEENGDDNSHYVLDTTKL
jgi:hypothetical protein